MTSKLYIMRYPDETPVLYKLGTSSEPNQRMRDLKKPSRDKPGFDGYSGTIEIIAIYFVSNARKAEGMLSRFLKDYRVPKEKVTKKFGTFEIYQFTDEDLKRVDGAIKSMFLGWA